MAKKQKRIPIKRKRPKTITKKVKKVVKTEKYLKNKCHGSIHNLFLVIIYDTSDIMATIMTYQEVKSLDFESYHCCLADCIGKMGFKDSKGDWKEFKKKGRLIKSSYLKVLLAIMFNPGVRKGRDEIIKLTGLKRLFNYGEFPLFIHRIRECFYETNSKKNLIITYDDGVLKLNWPRQASWIIVKPLLPQEIQKIMQILEKIHQNGSNGNFDSSYTDAIVAIMEYVME